ncbi:MAG TPA: hypothetical protein VKU90_06430 [Caulobacteraceae bacterium]|nr:hypothetical protein [Caulobacteraceae bacterium]
MAALLSATAGFLISQSHLFSAPTPIAALVSAFYMIIYTALFASAPLTVVTCKRMIQRKGSYLPFALSLVAFSSSYVLIGRNLVQFAANQQSLSVTFSDLYSGPILILPMIWLVVFVFDEVQSADHVS